MSASGQKKGAISLRVSLRLRAMLAIVGFGLVAFAVFFYLASHYHHELLEEQARYNYSQAAQILASALSEAITRQEFPIIRKVLATARQDSDIVALLVRGAQGKLIAQWMDPRLATFSVTALPFQPESQPRFQELTHDLPGAFHQSGHLFYITVPSYFNGARVGWLQLCVLTTRLNQALAKTTYWGLRLLAIYFVIGVVVIVFIDHRLRQAIYSLIETIEAMSKGDLKRQVSIRTGDILEKLAEHINRMAFALNERNRQVEHYQHNLEKMVERRTRAVRRERNKLRAILDHFPGGFLLLDKNLKIVTASANFDKLFGQFRDPNHPSRCGKGIWPATDCNRCPSCRALEQQQVISESFKLETPGGQVRFFEQTAIPIYRKRQIEGVLEIVTDVTERMTTREKLIKAERLSTAGEIAAVIAHEARNSLTSIKMILQMLREKQKTSTASSRSVEVALDSVDHLEGIVNQLLQFSRPAPLKVHPCSLPGLIQDVLGLLQPELQKRQIRVIWEDASKLDSVLADETRIKEALVNLLINAGDSIGEKGEIHLQISQQTLEQEIHDQMSFLLPEPRENGDLFVRQPQEIVLPAGTQVVCIRVTDSGAGIPGELIDKIFEPFFTTKTKGTGLGLPLVKRIANEHGGTVLCQNLEQGGAQFEIIIPLRDGSDERKNHDRR